MCIPDQQFVCTPQGYSTVFTTGEPLNPRSLSNTKDYTLEKIRKKLKKK